MASVCSIEGCGNPTGKAGHILCIDHWRAQNADTSFITAASLADEFGLTSTQINKVLAEIGWIEKEGGKGWQPTAQGKKLLAGAAAYKGNAYVKWPKGILASRILRNAVAEFQAAVSDVAPGKKTSQSDADISTELSDFRKRYPAEIRAPDGHLVRSRGELVIDHWLYMSGVVHAYERKVPIDEELYCDFYIPQGKVYVEYWGLEDNPQYKERKTKKVALYHANSLRLIQLRNRDIAAIDDVLPKRLREFGITVD